MDVFDRAINSIITAVSEFVDKRLSSASYDKTLQGVVKEILPSGKYKVSLQGSDYILTSCINQTFRVNDNVLILCVQNDMKRLYILGCVNRMESGGD